MGEIIFWGIIRTAIVILVAWFMIDYSDYKFWWSAVIISIYVIIIHPAVVQYQLFKQKNKKILSNTICRLCKHFDESAILCLKYDEHPNINNIPCNGEDFEPKN